MIKAVIFDLDGTVLDNEVSYGKAFSDILAEVGVTPETQMPHTRGIGLKANWQNFITKYSIDTHTSLDDLVLLTQKRYLEYIDLVKVRGGFEEFVYGLQAKKVKTALATSNTRQMADEVLSHFLLSRFFDVVVTADDVALPKPAPDIFLKAAQELGVEPAHCLVIEDAEAGVTAAKEAGMGSLLIGSGMNSFTDIDISVMGK